MLVFGFACCYAALAVFGITVLKPWRPKLGPDRRRPAAAEGTSVLSRMTGITSSTIEEVLNRRGWTRAISVALEHAGLVIAPADFLILAGAACLVAIICGALLGGPLLGLFGALACALGVKMYLSFLAGKRRKKFADQLDDSLQLLSGGLRAGHSLQRAVDAVSQQAPSPTAEEFSRIMNETRIGRDLTDAMDQTAERMKSEDFSWVSQAIGIHREVGGDLADVLDQVGRTIRERNQIQRQVKALSAEGKMSAYVLMALPVLIIGVLAIISPSYIVSFGSSPLGWGMVAGGILMMTVGGLWLKKIVSFKF
ncbi:type II secretion system protein (plasmid) [Pseudarthrobacter chlorophenolicus A6]|uniref:Type II secretion system protein n=1 Tax=Pseudarthrobacter chlorophenolicus (strain ATCC 700700 / DSM 12829 / CIP 107037 / JCM 12360 / KCTC 9906 / NCIMB 13794 / A6) TaxID=452863 RepID=B8HIZ9_PSECP|nr:type II secretion system F family protein [Pseudarthrobacter chlorophenolicus]ACL42396.1 type II secretion system protein [Pseudarthrobacter chlorophenolicus A6]SDQ17560.1 tight adherence protein B [Pseudarthrobacter chlorophenolicus]